ASAARPATGILLGVVPGPPRVAASIAAIPSGIGGNLARAGLLTGLIGLIAAIVSANIVSAVDQTGQTVALSTMPAISLSWIGWLTAGIVGINYLTAEKSELRITGTATHLQAGWPART